MKQFLFLLFTLAAIHSQAQSKEGFYKKASDFFDHKDYANAVEQIDLALELDPDNSEYLLLKGNSLYELKQYQSSYDTYTKIITLHPGNVIALNQRGLLLNTIGEFDRSIKDFDTALSFASADSLRLGLLINRGAAKTSIRDFQGAYNDYLDAYKIDSLQIGTLNNLATVCDEVGKGDQTLKYLYRILQIDSTFTGAYGNIGFKYQQMGNYKLSVQFFDKVLSMDPDDAIAYNNRGYDKLKLGDIKGALSDINKSISLYPGNSYAFRNRALVFIQQKKFNEACADLDTAIKQGFTQMYGDEVEKLKSKYCSQRGL